MGGSTAGPGAVVGAASCISSSPEAEPDDESVSEESLPLSLLPEALAFDTERLRLGSGTGVGRCSLFISEPVPTGIVFELVDWSDVLCRPPRPLPAPRPRSCPLPRPPPRPPSDVLALSSLAGLPQSSACAAASALLPPRLPPLPRPLPRSGCSPRAMAACLSSS